MSTILAFSIIGLVIHQAVAFLRNAFDKNDRLPKALWNLVPWMLGIIVAVILCNVHSLQNWLHLASPDCVATVLLGLGFGSVAAFWHSVLGWLGAPHVSINPKGLSARAKDETGAVDIVTALLVVFLAVIIVIVLFKLL